ncbi:MAG: hypothetical protein Q8R92_05565, partial [Deltaproteobacteria bacterium]|nr:hypothetical protein [Deltaproteobacteria bacterium]
CSNQNARNWPRRWSRDEIRPSRHGRDPRRLRGVLRPVGHVDAVVTLRLVWFATGAIAGWFVTLAAIVWLMDRQARRKR